MGFNQIASCLTIIEVKDESIPVNNDILKEILDNMTFEGIEQPLYSDKVYTY